MNKAGYFLLGIFFACCFVLVSFFSCNNPTTTATPPYFGKTMESTAKPVRDTFNGAVYDVYKKTTTISWDSLVPIGVVANTPPPVDTVVTPPVDNGDLPVGYVEIYRNDFSKTTDLNPGNHSQQGLGKLNASNFISLPSSFESIPTSVSSGYRSEIQMETSQTAPDGGIDFWINFQNYTQTGWGGHCVQAHPAGSNSGGSATVSIYFTEGKFQLMRNLGGSNMFSGTKAIEKNKWYHVRLMAKWSTGTDGSFDLYIDDMKTPYLSYKGRTQADNSLPYWKLGQNNFGSSKGIPILYDNFRILRRA